MGHFGFKKYDFLLFTSLTKIIQDIPVWCYDFIKMWEEEIT
jgi:hypothetical protein